MTIAFKHPEYLYFLCAIVIPIIIHLFSFRKYKKIYYHNIHLIKSIQIEQNSTKSKLKELLILASRIGFIIFLVLTFAQPYIPNKDANKESANKAIALYIDNSFSTQAESANGIVLEYEKIKANQIIEAYPANTPFYLFTNALNSTELLPKTKEEIQNEIEQITTYPQSKKLSEIDKKIQTCAIQNKKNIECHILSDYQKNTFDIANISQNDAVDYFMYYVGNQSINNVSIDSCYFENQQHSLGQTEKMICVVSNNSDETFANYPIKLYINDSLKAITTTNLKPHSTVKAPIEYTLAENGIISGKIEIEDYPILYDNTYYFSYFTENQILIADLCEKTPNQYISALCKKKQEFSLTAMPISTIDYSQLHRYQVIILDGLTTISTGLIDELQKLKHLGTTIICIPSKEIDITTYNKLLSFYGKQQITAVDNTQTTIESIDFNNIIFKNVIEKNKGNYSYPTINTYYQIQPTQNNTLITLENKYPFLLQQTQKNTQFFFFCSPFERTANNFVTSPLFVSLYNMLRYVSYNNPLQTTLGSSSDIFLQQEIGDEAIHIENTQKHVDIIPQYRKDYQTGTIHINPMQQLTLAGNYLITQKQQPILGISYNYDRTESILDFFLQDELQQMTDSKIIDTNENLTTIVKEQQEGTPLWRIALLLAIFFIITEMALILFYDAIIDKSTKRKQQQKPKQSIE